MIIHFTIEARRRRFVIKRKARDSNPDLLRRRTALAPRPGQPYPATFRIRRGTRVQGLVIYSLVARP